MAKHQKTPVKSSKVARTAQAEKVIRGLIGKHVAELTEIEATIARQVWIGVNKFGEIVDTFEPGDRVVIAPNIVQWWMEGRTFKYEHGWKFKADFTLEDNVVVLVG